LRSTETQWFIDLYSSKEINSNIIISDSPYWTKVGSTAGAGNIILTLSDITSKFNTNGGGGTSGGLDIAQLKQFLRDNGYETLLEMWEMDNENYAVYSKYNVYSQGTMAMKELGSGSGEVTPTIPQIGIVIGNNEAVYPNEQGLVLLPAYPEVGLDENALREYLTTNQYAKKSDIPSLIGYATEQWVLDKKYALASDLTVLRTDFDNLNTLLNGNVGGVIDTWNEVVAFLDGYSQSDDLATILSGMNAAIGTNSNNISAVSNRVQKFEDIIDIDKNGDVYIKGTRNFYTEGGTIGMAGLGSGGGGDVPSGGGIDEAQLWNILGQSGTQTIHSSHIPDLSGKYLPLSGGTIDGATTYPLIVSNSTDTLVGTVFSANSANRAIILAGGDWHAAFVNPQAGYKAIGVRDDGTPFYGDSSIQNTLYHTGNFNPANYLPLSGGTIESYQYDALEIKRMNAYDAVIKYSNASGVLGYIGLTSSGVPYYSPTGDSNAVYTLLHSGNIGSYNGSIGVSEVKFSSSGKFDSYGNFHFTANAGTWAVCSNDGKDILLVNNNTDNILIGTTTDNGHKLQVAGALSLDNVVLANTSSALLVQTPSGNSWFGMMNDSYCHIYTDASLFYMNKPLLIEGNTVIHSGNIGSQSVNYASSAGQITSETTQLCAATEHSNEITIVNNSSSSINVNAPNSLAALTKAIDFRWYDSHWQIGNIRSNGTPSSGFGITSGNSNLCFRVTESDCYVGSNTIIHSGNIGSQSVDFSNYSGYISEYDLGAYLSTKTASISGWYDWGNITGESFETYTHGLRITSPDGNYYTYLAFGATEGLEPRIRHIRGGVLGSWKTIAFTNSNVASATKLQTARTIWGQSFDGSANIGDNGKSQWLYLNSGGEGIYITASAIAWHNSYNSFAGRIMEFTSSGNVLIGTTIDDGFMLNVNGEAKFVNTTNVYGEYTATRLTQYVYQNIGRLYVYNDNDGGFKDLWIGNNSGTALTVKANGNVLIGTTEDNGYKVNVKNTATASYDLHTFNSSTNSSFYVGFEGLWYGTAKTSGQIFTIMSGCAYDGGGGNTVLQVTAEGNLTVTGDITSEGTIAMARLASSSDRKLKDNIAEVSAEQSLSIIRQLRPTTWDWKKDGKKSYGFIAQEVAPIVPEMVVDMGHLHLEYNQLHAFEIGAIQHLDVKVETQEQKIERLENRVNELENELKQYRRA
jgi:hypothetical protein